MIWGCQWDMVCNYIANYGEKKDIRDSRAWGNYYDSISPADVTGKGTLQNTGYSEYWSANNIFDFAGNYGEWTQEAISNNGRQIRGGGASSYGTNGCTGSTAYAPTSGTNASRPTIYITE